MKPRVPLEFTLNASPLRTDVQMHDSLLDVLRQHGCASVKRVCETADCGACSVIVDGRLVDSCITLALQVDGGSVETAESLGNNEALHPLQECFLSHAAVQCGFCIPGMVLSMKHLLDTQPDATEAEIREVMTLCRCSGYVKPVEAVLAYQRTLEESKAKIPL